MELRLTLSASNSAPKIELPPSAKGYTIEFPPIVTVIAPLQTKDILPHAETTTAAGLIIS